MAQKKKAMHRTSPALVLLIAALVIWCHRENITRLLHHQERKFQWHTGTPKEKE